MHVHEQSGVAGLHILEADEGNVTSLFGQSILGYCNKAVAGETPKTLVSDGAANFHEAYLKEFYTSKLETRPEHIRHVRLSGDYNNNKMERMNGEIRDRERVMRTLEKPDTAILTGMQLYHNYIRPHEALKGKTPSEAAGIKVEGDNKWLTLIQNAGYKVIKTEAHSNPSER